jgi:hypothetical protein
MHGPRTRLHFSLGQEMCKIMLWKQSSVSICGSFGETWRVGYFIGQIERYVKGGSRNGASRYVRAP